MARVSVASCFLLVALTAQATHFRGGILRGVTDGSVCANGASFTIEYTVRRDGYAGSDSDGHPAVGDVVFEFIGTPQLIFGDGMSTPQLNMRVVAIDKVLNKLTAFLEVPSTTTPGRITHCYALAGTYTIAIDTCCTISTDPLNHDSPYRLETILTIPSAQLCPIVSGTSNVDVIQGTTLSFQIPAADPGGLPLSYRLATAAESKLSIPIPGLSVSSSGLVTWPVPVTQPVGPYDVEFMVENGICKVPYFLTITVVPPGANQPPQFIPPSPCSQTVKEAVSVPFTLSYVANDPNPGDIVQLNNLGLPAGATFVKVDGNPARGTFGWTPPSLGFTIVTFTATDGSFIVSCSTTLEICSGPTSVVSGGGTVCQGTPASIQAALSGAPPFVVAWSDGFIQSVPASPAIRSVTPSVTTGYTVTSLQDSTGCPGTSTGIAVVKVIPLPSATIAAAASVCQSSSGNAASVPDAGAGATYVWTIANGSITSGAGSRSILYSAGASGSVTLGVTVTAGGCSKTGAATVPISPTPAATLTGTQTVCAGSPANLSVAVTGTGPFTVKFSDGITTTSPASPVVRTVFPSGNTTYTLTSVTDGLGCPGTTSGSAVLTVKPVPSASVSSGGGAGCPGTSYTISVDLTGTPPWTIIWSDGFTQGPISTSPVTRVVSPDDTALFAVASVSDATGCSAGGSGAFVVNVSPSAATTAITAPYITCPGIPLPASVVGGPGLTYAWTISKGTILSAANTRQITFQADPGGPVVLAVTAVGAGCQRTQTASVQVYPVPAEPVITGPASATSGDTGLLAHVTRHLDHTYRWTIDNGIIRSGGATPDVVFDVGFPGTTTLTVTETNPYGCSASSSFVLPVGGLVIPRMVPIVLDVFGVGNAHFTSELTLGNPGVSTASVELLYTPALALGASVPAIVTESLPPGRQKIIPDVLEYFRQKGFTIPPGSSSSQGGTVRVTFRNIPSGAAAYAGARTTAPSGPGVAGLGYQGPLVVPTLPDKVYLFGLRENAADRSNLALLNAGSDGPVSLRVTLFSGTGDGRKFVFPDLVTLDPGQWLQFNAVLNRAGFTNGFALVERVSGTDPFLAYAVFNDNATNDGSFVSAVAAARAAGPQMLPVIVETGAFESELVLTNPGDSPVDVSMSFTESLTASGVTTGTVHESLVPFGQKIIPKVLEYLRGKGATIGARGGAYAGTLYVQFSVAGAQVPGFVGARTAAPAAGGGEYGFFASGVSLGEAAQEAAFVFGLRQNATTRSNLAIVNASTNQGPVTLEVQIFDGDTGNAVGKPLTATLFPGGWKQYNAILAPLGLTNGYARIRRTDGHAPWAAYGVANDGATPISGATNDGSHISMTPLPSSLP